MKPSARDKNTRAMQAEPTISRFAPSPTGRLHLGHAYSALLSYRLTRERNGRFLLRIEDIDSTRCREEFDQGIVEDLAWLGLSWEAPVRRQSRHLETYKRALEELAGKGLLYRCYCTRKEIRAAKPRMGPDGPVYPGICRDRAEAKLDARPAPGVPFALRLDLDKAMDAVGGAEMFWVDEIAGAIRAAPEELGDVVLARKDIGTSYHLAVTVDDAVQGVNFICRGMDLFAATHVHRLLQQILDLPVPVYHHHALLRDASGDKLAKRLGSQSLKELRESGVTAADIRARLGLTDDWPAEAQHLERPGVPPIELPGSRAPRRSDS